MYGFKEKWHAEILKQFAENNLQNGVQLGNALFSAGNGSRIFIVSLPNPIPAFQDGTPGSGTAEIKYLKSPDEHETEEDESSEGFEEQEPREDSETRLRSFSEGTESDESVNTEELVPYLYDDGDPVVWDIHNLSGHSIPKTPERPKPEDLRLAIQDSFGHLYLLPEVSELFGTLAEHWELGDKTAKVINLDEGFERSPNREVVEGVENVEVFKAFPAPTLSERLTSGTPVTCRYIKAVGKWFFFRPSRSGSAAEVDASGTALGGMGTFQASNDEMLEIWASQLAAGSEPVSLYKTPAVKLPVTAYGSEDDTPWIDFPTIMNNSPETVRQVRGNYYRADDGKIWEKQYLGRVLIDDQDTLYYPTFWTFNGCETWNSDPSGSMAGIWIYFTTLNSKWMKSSFLGTLPDDPNVTQQGNFGADSLEELGLSDFVKPCWECESEYGIYLPKSGTSASGEILFGVPQFSLESTSLETPTFQGGIFERSLKRETVEISNSVFSVWRYEGTFALDTDESIRLSWQDISCRNHEGTLQWILGIWGDSDSGWWELSGEPDQTAERFMTFRIITKTNKRFTTADILQRIFNERISETDEEFRIHDTDAARWTLPKMETNGVSFTFEFTLPDNNEEEEYEEEGSDPEILEDITVTLDDLLRKARSLPEIHYSEEKSLFYIGVPEDPNGWWEAPENLFTETFIFTHRPVFQETWNLNFNEWVKGNFTQDVWKVEPEIVT